MAASIVGISFNPTDIAVCYGKHATSVLRADQWPMQGRRLLPPEVIQIADRSNSRSFVFGANSSRGLFIGPPHAGHRGLDAASR